MATGAEKDERGRFTNNDRLDTEGMIEERRRMLEHTAAFLGSVGDGDGAGRRYIEGLKTTLESDLRRLERDRLECDGGREAGSDEKS